MVKQPNNFFESEKMKDWQLYLLCAVIYGSQQHADPSVWYSAAVFSVLCMITGVMDILMEPKKKKLNPSNKGVFLVKWKK